ncbi:uracil phosphoribosyltransferase [Melanomma pulvis-pyrius CBS 109.77]|uniref:Uracil phosphoribosyltransferase n=1 Tax=Melanomma pulvis-pyrius CBS 109.77 TaxID=1314802 RepID=A0A6A6WWH3_9PLEO|nr:uracil phosphoribosyltransferase [Melanomma pulvis-pyrius CBS 109.77]
MPSSVTDKPIVVGVYGVSGCGKTYILNTLNGELGHPDHRFKFVDGSTMISNLVPNGLQEFKKLPSLEKKDYRERAIDSFRHACKSSRTVGVVAGHYMLWDDESADAGERIWTDMDADVYTHVLYLDVPAETVAARRKNDTNRQRPELSVEHLRKWQDVERTQLRDLCREKGILFSVISGSSGTLDSQDASTGKIVALLRDFQRHNEGYNLCSASESLDAIVDSHGQTLETMLVLDADRTLAAEDTGSIFWKMASSMSGSYANDPLKTLFKTRGYSYHSFRQATLIYEETADDFDSICEGVASKVNIYPEFVSLLRRIKEHNHIGAVVVTCGLRRVWEKVLERNGLTHVKVIGGSRISDDFVITGSVKGALVDRLLAKKLYVWAFGDSPLDLEMLEKADQAVLVVGKKEARSTTMDDALNTAIDNGLRVRQVVVPNTETPRLDIEKVPCISLEDSHVVDSVLCHRIPKGSNVFHATGTNTAKVLMTATRDARVFGPPLREVHRLVGWYLSMQFLANLIGVEEHLIPHVQGKTTTGHRLRHEERTVIVPLMRGGEAMAFGVNDAFPLASFLHASGIEDVKPLNLNEKCTAILVDSVINTGKSMVEFVERIRELNPSILIVIVAGVVQAKAVSKGKFADVLSRDQNLSLVALRLSENKYTGKGGTDTGHRLFNTTDQD